MADDRAAAMAALRAEGLDCTRCDLHLTGFPVVWGEGDPHAQVMLIGQGPGEQETKTGRPFVGPAGQVLDELLAEAAINRGRLWITNALKHWATTRNERNRVVNRAPKVGELRACQVWWQGEVEIVQPRVIVCIGAPAAQAVIDKNFKMTAMRGQWFDGPNGAATIAMVHPSYLIRLRAADPRAAAPVWDQAVADLRAVAARARELGIDLS